MNHMRQLRYDDGSWSRTLEGAPTSTGWSTADRRKAIAESHRRWNVESQHSLVEQRDHDLYGMGARNGFILGAEWWKFTHDCLSEPQGEPSDAQVSAFIEAVFAEGYRIPRPAVVAALRAAGGVR